MPRVVIDASTLVGALLRAASVPDRAVLLARARGIICLSANVEAEIRDVLARPKFRAALRPGRVEEMLELITASALRVEPATAVRDCRDPKDNKYLELALAAGAEVIVSSDKDLLALDPWRGIRILSPVDFVAAFEA